MSKHSTESKSKSYGLQFLLKLVFLFSFINIGAQDAIITGIVLDEDQNPIPDVAISYRNTGTTTAEDGSYLFGVVADKAVTISFSHIGFEKIVLKDLILSTNETFEFNPVMSKETVQVAGVTITPNGTKKLKGVTTVSPEIIRNIPGANAGVENILKLLPGVSFNNELSTQYNVRGGNFDENLVYVNGIQVYKPFLIRSAQQEGFSFVNPDMVQSVEFSAGGFQAKYGDKLSSVLDIRYKQPTKFSLKTAASLIDASTTIETITKNRKWSSISGVRYRDNSLFINSQQTETNVKPVFFDAQSYLSFKPTTRLRFSLLGNFSVNDYQNEPLARQTNFGTIQEPRALAVYYQGQEQTKFQTEFLALNSSILVNNNLKLDFSSSIYHTLEQEFSDVIAAYELGPVETNANSSNFGSIVNATNIGGQINRARNELDALIYSVAQKGKLKINEQQLDWGITYTVEDFRDQLNETEFLDSAGVIIRPPNSGFTNNEPFEPYDAPILPFERVAAYKQVKTERITSYTQWSTQTEWKEHTFYLNGGVRAHWWNVNPTNTTSKSQIIWSPRAQIAVKPNWNADMLFRLAVGSYQQPPFYRELRGFDGQVNPNVKAQRSTHFVVGNEYSFRFLDRPFFLTSEAYYKKMSNVNPYTLEDVRIRYLAENIAKAYAYGLDFRLSGTFVPGIESWVSLGYLKTEENWDDEGYIARPTDQRLKMAMLFQDYMPNLPQLRLYINLVYNTGVPGGSPNYENPYNFQNRLRDYKRADLGISYIFADVNTNWKKKNWQSAFKELAVGFEIFNLFNNQNSITNTWVRDATNQNQYAVPNYLTSRIFNIKLNARF